MSLTLTWLGVSPDAEAAASIDYVHLAVLTFLHQSVLDKKSIRGYNLLATQKAAKPSNMESNQKTQQEKTMAQVLLTGADSASSSSITWYTYKSHE